MRETIADKLKEALKARDARRTSTLRMISSAIKDKDIEARGNGGAPATDSEIATILQKMVKQREESVAVYAGAGRNDLATAEAEEIAILREFLPEMLGEGELDAAIQSAIAATGASGGKDMGKVIAELKKDYAGRIDFGAASGRVKAALAG